MNYLALLGWSIGPDRDIFTLEEMVSAFDIADVNPNPARFDLTKAEAINAAHMRALPLEDYVARLVPYLHEAGYVSSADPRTLAPQEEAVLAAAAPLVHERMNMLSEAPGMLGFFFVADEAIEYDPAAVAKLPDNAHEILSAGIEVLAQLDDFSAETQQAALRATLVEEMGIKPRFAFGPLRVGITGRVVSPPLFESMEIVGQPRAIARLERFAATLSS